MSIKNKKIISVASSGNESDSSWLFHHISQILAHLRLNDSFRRKKKPSRGEGGVKQGDQPLPPTFAIPYRSNHPPLKWDRDSDPQRS